MQPVAAIKALLKVGNVNKVKFNIVEDEQSATSRGSGDAWSGYKKGEKDEKVEKEENVMVIVPWGNYQL
eukprot:1525412-Heterocapsa_arctica.AAC.1